MASGKGCRLTDADGRSYVDYCLSWGPLILGHAFPKITAAASAAARKGASFGAPTEGETKLAELVQAAFPSMELMRLTSSGTEAVMSALRVARAFTKRTLVIKFTGCYHGHVDSLLVAAGSGAMTLGQPDSAGVPRAWAQTTLSLPYNDTDAVKAAFRRWGPEIAAVIVEPVVGNMGTVRPEDGFLESLRAETARAGAVLIFDEVITGFRFRFGGAQGIWKIKPDLTCLGKIVGGGFPIGVYGGRREIMEKVAPLGPVYQAGTLSGNPVAVAAGIATLETLKSKQPFSRMGKLAEKLCDGLAKEAKAAGIAAGISRYASMFTVFFSPRPVRDYVSAKEADTAAYASFFHALWAEGIYFPPAQFEAAFVSAAHGDKEIAQTLRAASKAFAAVKGV